MIRLMLYNKNYKKYLNTKRNSKIRNSKDKILGDTYGVIYCSFEKNKLGVSVFHMRINTVFEK